jgi:arylsulfatase A-like enzyme
MRNTLIVFTSDHGNSLGDHWLGEKEIFHEPSVRVLLIVYDPDPASDASRGQIRRQLHEQLLDP